MKADWLGLKEALTGKNMVQSVMFWSAKCGDSLAGLLHASVCSQQKKLDSAHVS